MIVNILLFLLLNGINSIMFTLTENKFCLSKKFFKSETAILIYDISEEGNIVKTELYSDVDSISNKMYESKIKKDIKEFKINKSMVLKLCFTKENIKVNKNNVISINFYHSSQEAKNSLEIEKKFKRLSNTLNEIENNLKMDIQQKDGQLESCKKFVELINKIGLCKIMIVLGISAFQFILILFIFVASDIRKVRLI